MPAWALAAAAVLALGALVVRGWAPARLTRPADVPIDERPKLRDPLQLLGPAAALRAQELDALVSERQRSAFSSLREALFRLDDCPELLEWSNGADGQRFERLFHDLRGGTREDAIAALALVFRLGRATEWRPGLRGRTEHTERLGAYLQDWLRSWGEPGARDPLLSDPALAATLAYGHVMQIAWKAPLVGLNAAPYERATAFLGELVGTPPARRTALGETLLGRYPRAVNRLLDPRERLAGCAEEFAVLMPDFTGECGR